ncbi:unnamed protein product [Symbiodinium sp. CCMP2592]|nr:unnamed protein product [Symbiodinium sp. CCMP2592]
MGMKGKFSKGSGAWRSGKSKGFQKGKPMTGKASENASTEDWSAPAETPSTTRRMIARNCFGKALLRPYASEDLSFLYLTDENFFQKSELRSYLTAENSELDRRPAYGWSMMCGSLRSLISALPGEKLVEGMTELNQLLEREKKLEKALQKCAWESYKQHHKDFKACAAEILKVLKENSKALHRILPVIMTECAKLYGGAAQTLDGVVHADALQRWQTIVPDWPEGSKALKRWRKDKPTLQSTAEFLEKAYEARKHVEKSWQVQQAWHGDDSSLESKEDSSSGANPWGRYGDPASSSSDAKKKKSKKAGKPKKSGKKPKKTKKVSSSETSEATDPKLKKKFGKKAKKASSSDTADAVETKTKKHKKDAESADPHSKETAKPIDDTEASKEIQEVCDDE